MCTTCTEASTVGIFVEYFCPLLSHFLFNLEKLGFGHLKRKLLNPTEISPVFQL